MTFAIDDADYDFGNEREREIDAAIKTVVEKVYKTTDKDKFQKEYGDMSVIDLRDYFIEEYGKSIDVVADLKKLYGKRLVAYIRNKITDMEELERWLASQSEICDSLSAEKDEERRA